MLSRVFIALRLQQGLIASCIIYLVFLFRSGLIFPLQNVYFYTSVKDINVLVVFELIAVENNDGRSRRYSKGWTILRPFSSDDVKDISSNKEPTSQRL